jgi:hypothetical protein
MDARSTRVTATAAALAFAVGTILIPTLHLAFHELPHDHDGGETHYHFAFPEPEDHHHDHGEDDLHSIEPEEEGHHDDDDHHPQPLDPHHGDGSAAHFSLAVSEKIAAPQSPVVVAPIEQGLVPFRECDSIPRCTTRMTVRFRGPPPG